MATVNMPKLSDTMEEGTVVVWKKAAGDEVKRGDVLAEIESDKATFDLEAEAEGVLTIAVEAGRAVPVGSQIATIGADEASASATGAAEAGPTPSPAPTPPPTPAPAPPVATALSPAPQPVAAPPRAAANGGAAPVSPRARRIADALGVDLTRLGGSGPGGRIVEDDVIGSLGGRQPQAAAPAPRQPSRPRPLNDEVEEPSRMQATIAQRMALSKSTVPHFYVTMEARVDQAVKIRQGLKEGVAGAEKVTMTDLVVRACAITLARFPEVNSSWVEGRLVRRSGISIGLAVPTSEGIGLLVPVVHDADKKDVVQISIESRQVIERARAGRPHAEDLAGATFSVSNLGMYGVDEFQAIINPPEAAILAVGAIKKVPVVEGDRIGVGQTMSLTLSCDHRVFYGSTAAEFLAELRRVLENPVLLVAAADAAS